MAEVSDVPARTTPNFTREQVAPDLTRQLVSKKWARDRLEKWGERSPLYSVRVDAEFPGQSDDVVVSLADLEAAQRRAVEPGSPLVVAVDVARFGSDATVLAVRRGCQVRIAKADGGRDLMRTTGEITRLARQLRDTHGKAPVIVMDDAGLGGGVTDRLRELGEFRVRPYLGAEAAKRSQDYPNRRSESWFGLAEVLDQVDIDADEELAADLLAPRYSLDSAGRRVVEPKSATKKRLRRSPDRGDAVVMAFSELPLGRRRWHPVRIYSASGVRLPRVSEVLARRDWLGQW